MPTLRIEQEGYPSLLPALIQFGYLQLLDFLTTIAFLIHGVREANPVVRLFLENAPHPIWGLLGVKLAALLLAFYCVRMQRRRLLIRINWLFAIVVAWNLIALIIGSARA